VQSGGALLDGDELRKLKMRSLGLLLQLLPLVTVKVGGLTGSIRER